MTPKNITVIYQYNLFDLFQDDTELIADLEPSEYHFNIVFINGVFGRCDYHFEKPYDRSKWRILVLIEKEISRLESIQKSECK